MKVVTENGIWVVKAQWFGAERTVYSGDRSELSPYRVAQWAADQRAKDKEGEDEQQ